MAPGYDTLELCLLKSQCKGVTFLTEIPKFLTRLTMQGTSEFGPFISGKLGSLEVSISENRVKIKNSSLCKYYLGNSFQTLSRENAKSAVEKISDDIHLPFQIAEVTKIHLAQNFTMQFDERLYYKYLGQAQYYKRLEQENGLYYNNPKKQLVFYGKLREQKAKKEPIPEYYKNSYLLRLEGRLNKRVSQQMNQPSITGKMLYDESFYGDLIKSYKKEYMSISKIALKIDKMKPTGSIKELIENFAHHTIMEIGQPNVLGLIKEWQSKSHIDKHQAHKLRKGIIELCSITNSEELRNELIDELDKKIIEACQCW